MKAKRGLLLLLVFVGGMTSLGVELTASRLLDPFFGNSLIIRAVLIGMVLLYLTVGDFSHALESLFRRSLTISR